MKTALDPRHQKRNNLLEHLFPLGFQQNESVDPVVKDLVDHLPAIDEKIKVAAPQWPISKIAKIDLAILRLACYELLKKKEPPKVIIDEAIELAKEFGNPTSPKLVNGVLGTILTKL
jgi:N utilization substance protein B